jgi:hypothetical protein
VYVGAALAGELCGSVDGGRRDCAPLGGEEHAIP